MNRWLDRGITLLLLALLGWAGWSMLHWLLMAADWSVVTTNLPLYAVCLLYTSPSPRDKRQSRMPSSA